jgi:transcriptional regulator with GAF, ATPase, and Fis domain
MVKEGTFREDLWYRISVFPIRIPPLRERVEDIRHLAHYFALRAAQKFHLPEVIITREDIEILERHSWPGNVREFGAVIDRAVLLGDGTRLALHDSLLELHGENVLIKIAQDRHLSSNHALSQNDALLVTEEQEKNNDKTEEQTENEPEENIEVLTLDEVVRQHIESVLTLTHGTVEGESGAASLLKINPHTLRARMRKLGIDWSKFRRSAS